MPMLRVPPSFSVLSLAVPNQTEHLLPFHGTNLRETNGDEERIHTDKRNDTHGQGTGILFKHRNKTAREIVEALWIDRLEEKCISHPSVALLDREIAMLSAYL
uniref:Tick transposon n=1 Tax=Rhipicephalus appendiculatus TaxID=34631 RepID=A0A131YFW6_RHIAP